MAWIEVTERGERGDTRLNYINLDQGVRVCKEYDREGESSGRCFIIIALPDSGGKKGCLVSLAESYEEVRRLIANKTRGDH